MEKVKKALNELKEINVAYSLDVGRIDALLEEMKYARVCTPVIGKFSSGKSALINRLLVNSYTSPLLKTDVTPETAVPTEIMYQDGLEQAVVIKKGGAPQGPLSLQEYRSYQPDTSAVKCVQLYLDDSFLRDAIPDVMLVDMPGFESGLELHNKAIDDYVARSQAYVVAFPADDMVITSSIGSVLKELCIHEMPICIVITKRDKFNADDFDEAFEDLKLRLKQFIGDRNISYCITSSKEGDVEEFEDYLEHTLQSGAMEILSAAFGRDAAALIEETGTYLRQSRNSIKLSESEFAKKEEDLNRQLTSLQKELKRRERDLEQEASQCIDDILGDVKRELSNRESALVSLAIRGIDIKEKLNDIFREAVTESLRTRFVPILSKYLNQAEHTMNCGDLGDLHVSHFSFSSKLNEKKVLSSIVSTAGGLFVFGTPGAIVGFITSFIMKRSAEKGREQHRQEVRGRLEGEVFPAVIRESRARLTAEIQRQVDQAKASVAEECDRQKEILTKSLADTRDKLLEAQESKQAQDRKMTADLNHLKDLKGTLQE